MRKYVLIVSVVFFFTKNAFAQTDSISSVAIDTVPTIAAETIEHNEEDVAIDTAVVFAPEGETMLANLKYTDTFKPNPRKAVIYSAIFPGLGQIYNRKFWKVPIIYGGFVGLGYGISWNGQYYKDYKQAYKDFIDKDDTTNSFLNMLPPNQQDPNAIDASWFTSVLIQKKDFYRRNRDLCIIGMIGVYALCILDAFVDAQLFEFDISQDLTLNISPQVQPGRNSSSFGLYCQFNF